MQNNIPSVSQDAFHLAQRLGTWDEVFVGPCECGALDCRECNPSGWRNYLPLPAKDYTAAVAGR